MVDGVDTGKTTPTTLFIPKKKGSKVSISLRLKGYTPFSFRPVDAGESSQLKAELVKLKATTTSTTPPTGNGRTGQDGKKGSAARGSGDPDGLMPP